jgi:ketosteroid isomerase-like protein
MKKKETVEKANEAFAEGKAESFLSLCAKKMEWRVVGEKTVKGKDAIREWMASGMGNEEMSSELPKFTVSDIIAEDECVTTYGDMILKNNDGKIISFSYCDIYHFQGNKIIKLISFILETEQENKA